MRGNLITISVVVASAVVTFLLAQPDATFSSTAKLVLGALNIGLVTFARFLPSQAEPVQVAVTGPVAVTPAETAVDPEPPAQG